MNTSAETARAPLSLDEPHAEAEYFRLALEAGGIGAWDWDLASGVMHWSEQMYRTLGLVPGRTPASHELLLAAVHPSDREHARSFWEECRKRPGPMRVELRFPWPDGNVHWIVFLGQVTADVTGRPRRMRGITIDGTARRRGEEAVQDAAERLRLAVNAAKLGTWDFNLAKGRGRWSLECALVYGLPTDKTEVTLDEWKALVHPADRDLTQDAFNKAVECRGDFAIEYRIVHPDGKVRWVSVHGAVQTDPEGFPARLIGVVQDTTVRRHADEALRESEEKFRQIFEQSPLGKAVAGPDFRFQSVNPALCRMLGYSEDELNGRSFLDLVHPDDRPNCLAMGRSLVEGEISRLQIEERFIRKSGEPFWVSVNVGPICDSAGNVVCSLGIIEDIDERQHTRQALHESEQRLRELNEKLEQQAEERARQLASSRAQLQAFFDNSPDWLTLQRITPDGTSVYVDLNPTAEVAYGLSREQVIGRRLEEVLGDEAAQVPLHNLRECLRTGQPQRYVARRTMAGRTRIIDVMFALVPEEGPEGERFIITTARDITERDQLEAQLRHAQKMEAVGQLTGGIAHDFNNLLTGITGGIELALQRLKAGQGIGGERFLETALLSARRAGTLTHKLLAFSRRQALDPRPTAVARLVAETEELLRRTVGPTIRIETILPDALWPTLCDPQELETALLNLAINARDAMPDGGRLILQGFNTCLDLSYAQRNDLATGEYVGIAVADTGMGISPDVLAHVFEPFFTTKPTGMGTGLGLSMVYGFARQSGGHVEIESKVGQGTTVTLYLPRHRGELGNVPLPGEGRPTRIGGGETVLLVDDEQVVRVLIREVLQEHGYKVIEAEDGSAGLRLIRSGTRIDCMVTDVGLPGGMNGRQLADAARTVHPQLPVLFITGYAETAAARDNPLPVGMALVTKPFRMDMLLTKIAAMITHERQ